MNEHAEYSFSLITLVLGMSIAVTEADEVANDMARDGWLLDHVALSGSYLLLVFKRTHTPTPPHQTTDRDVPTTP